MKPKRLHSVLVTISIEIHNRVLNPLHSRPELSKKSKRSASSENGPAAFRSQNRDLQPISHSAWRSRNLSTRSPLEEHQQSKQISLCYSAILKVMDIWLLLSVGRISCAFIATRSPALNTMAVLLVGNAPSASLRTF
jgi:hypothetical protein